MSPTASTVALAWLFSCGSISILAVNSSLTRVTTPGGEVARNTPAEHTADDERNYAPARRAGDFVYVSGVVVGPQPGGPRTPETFKTAARRAFETLRSRLQALGAEFSDVVMINSYHNWSAAEFHGDRTAQFTAFREVAAEFMPPPYAAWTAVGTSALLREAGIVEVQMIAYAPLKAASGTERPERNSGDRVDY